ncbi:putative N-acetyltransferase YycN [Clostridium puniceum]|uniref:Putative N-acetyltransferase YycN n=1 Tax=Clostridium puniceum TaxID=29367 RepID=A0A1S8T9M3_9CLOT|nr:GNAT family N-acetyltransferase [Clostridium puniceum]OOM74135.1 putative N-acetyltransferase YycN [Clostridium puniceum]
MLQKAFNQSICLKEYITKKDYKEINFLQQICTNNDKVNLKLELDYKLNIFKNSEIGLNNINEFFYYIDETLVSYLGISSFGGNICEVNGMTHPNWRRKGIFKKLFEILVDEFNKRNINEILLLADGKSNSGGEFINNIGGKYDFSEYRMKRVSKVISERIDSIRLRKAENSDVKEIAKQNSIYFNDPEEASDASEIEILLNESAHVVELNGNIIGKINIEYGEDSAFICGFGILPDFRGRGYGKAALKEALYLINKKNIYTIELDVECKNSTALNLYKACGFEEKSIMNYYKYSTRNN